VTLRIWSIIMMKEKSGPCDSPFSQSRAPKWLHLPLRNDPQCVRRRLNGCAASPRGLCNCSNLQLASCRIQVQRWPGTLYVTESVLSDSMRDAATQRDVNCGLCSSCRQRCIAFLQGSYHTNKSCAAHLTYIHTYISTRRGTVVRDCPTTDC